MRDQDDSDCYPDSEEFEYDASEDDSQAGSRGADEALEVDQGRSSTGKGAPYRIIDASALKRVQVSII
jgi:hypothetical protein